MEQLKLLNIFKERKTRIDKGTKLCKLCNIKIHKYIKVFAYEENNSNYIKWLYYKSDLKKENNLISIIGYIFLCRKCEERTM